LFAVALSGFAAAAANLHYSGSALAQDQQAAATETTDAAAEAAPEPLSDEELQVLVARIALYPDELVALIVASSLYPLQIVEAQRYLDDVKEKPGLKPKADWDGSVISLLNYPQVVNMMSDDLDWTQELGEAITNQEKDVLQAIQLLREKAVADGVIKSDDKIKVVTEKEHIVIQPASTETVYIPQYPPEMLYEESYAPAPIEYYPDSYPYYYSPAAPYFAGFFTGAIFGAAIDWDDWGAWGGDWDGGDLDIDCNNCFNNREFSGKVDWKNADWKNIDRSKIKFDKNQLNKLDRNQFKNSLKSNNRNDLRNKSSDLKRNRASTLPSKGGQVKDVRKSTLEGLKSKPGQGARTKAAKPSQGAGTKRPGGGGSVSRPAGKPKPGGRADNRPKNPSPLGDVNRGGKAKFDSARGQKSMGGGMRSGGGAQKRFIPPSRGGGGGGGGGGRGGRR
jgi:hypothetical protein